MNLQRWIQRSPAVWELPPEGAMRVPARLFASEALARALDDRVAAQLRQVAALPGIVGAAVAMPDARADCGFPAGAVAAFDADEGGVVSAGGVGFDIGCGVRCLLTGLTVEQLMPLRQRLAQRLSESIPAGAGSTGRVRLNAAELDAMLVGGAAWAVEQGFGDESDLERIEDDGRMLHARAPFVSLPARRRQRDQMGTLGGGEHRLQVLAVAELFDAAAATAFGLKAGEVVVTMHCGARGLGHQVGSEYLLRMATEAARDGLVLPDRGMACVPIHSELGQEYLGAMRAAMNCAFANRQILTHLVRKVFAEFWPASHLPLLYDVAHDSCKLETHRVDGRLRRLHVQRKGAARAFGPGDADLPPALRTFGQPVPVDGAPGGGSFVLAGGGAPAALAFASTCHGSGQVMGRDLVAPGAELGAIVSASEAAGLARRVARLAPLASRA